MTKLNNVGATISVRSHVFEVIPLINSKLKGKALEGFKSSCFGHLLPLGDHDESKHQNQLLFISMMNMSMIKRHRSVPVFDFNGKDIEFGKLDFYLMTGLKFSEPVKAPTKSQIHVDVFKSKERLKFSEIKKEFCDKCELYEGDDELCLKLALLVFVYGVVLPRDNNDKNMDMRYIHIADSIDAFNQYPWGLLAYNYLCSSLFYGYDLMLPKLNRKFKEKPAFDLRGFVFALQCWLYEVLPSIGSKLAERVEGWSSCYPRVLRWKPTGTWHYTKVTRLLVSRDLEVKPLEYSDAEQLVLPPVMQYLLHQPIDPLYLDVEESMKQGVKRMLFDEGEGSSPKPDVVRKSRLRSGMKNVVEDDMASPEDVPSITTPAAANVGKTSYKQLVNRIDKLEGDISKFTCNFPSYLQQVITEAVVKAVNMTSKGCTGKQNKVESSRVAADAGFAAEDEHQVDLQMDENNMVDVPIVQLSSNNVVNSLSDGSPSGSTHGWNPHLFAKRTAVSSADEDEKNVDENEKKPEEDDKGEDESDKIGGDDEKKDTEDDNEAGERDKIQGEDEKKDDEDDKEEGEHDKMGGGDDKKENEDERKWDGDENKEADDDQKNEDGVDKDEDHEINGVAAMNKGFSERKRRGKSVARDTTLRRRPITRSCSFYVDYASLPKPVEPVFILGGAKKLALIDEVDSNGNTLSRSLGECYKEDKDLDRLVGDLARDILGFADTDSDSVEMRVLGDGHAGHTHAEIAERALLNTQSNPVMVSSSSDCSSHMNQCAISVKRLSHQIPPSRFSDAMIATKTETLSDESIDSKFDPLKKFPDSFRHGFNQWYENPPRDVNGRILTLCIYNPDEVGTFFFKNLTDRRSMLSTQHCDGILNILLLKARQMPHIFVDRWTLMESFAWRYFNATIPSEGARRCFEKYANGETPENLGKSWQLVEHVYGIANIDSNHFVAYDISIPDQQIVVYDSMCKNEARWSLVRSRFHKMSGKLAGLMDTAGVTHFKSERKDTWEVIMNEDTPQQTNLWDCGIYAVKFIECLASGRQVSYLSTDPGFAGRARLDYCAMFYNSRKRE